jgi:hypothetical protein
VTLIGVHKVELAKWIEKISYLVVKFMLDMCKGMLDFKKSGVKGCKGV